MKAPSVNRVMLRLSVLFIVSLAVIGCSQINLPALFRGGADIRRDFAELDRTYIPALALTNQGGPVAAGTAVLNFREAWFAFRKQYENYAPNDGQWKGDLDNISSRIDVADTMIRRDRDLKSAHETLEGVRGVLMNLRKRNGIDYYMDYLTEYHDAMEDIIRTARAKTPDTMTEADVNELRKLLTEAENRWDAVQEQPFDRDLFDLQDAEVIDMKRYMMAESDALNHLATVLKNDDRNAIAKAASALLPPFQRLFMLFGDFSEVQLQNGS